MEAEPLRLGACVQILGTCSDKKYAGRYGTVHTVEVDMVNDETKYGIWLAGSDRIVFVPAELFEVVKS